MTLTFLVVKMSPLFVQTEVFTEVFNFSCFSSFFCYLTPILCVYELCAAKEKQGNTLIGLGSRDRNCPGSFHQEEITLTCSAVMGSEQLWERSVKGIASIPKGKKNIQSLLNEIIHGGFASLQHLLSPIFLQDFFSHS